MLKILNIADSEANRLNFFLWFGFLASLPFDSFYSQILLACIFIHTIIHAPRQSYRNLFSQNSLILSSLFFLTLVYVLPAVDKKEAWSEVSKQAAIIIIPFTFAINGNQIIERRRNLLSGFSIVCSLVILYIYIDAFKTIFFFKLPISAIFSTYFMNHNFSAPLDIHATYLSMFLFITLIHSLSEALKRNNRTIRIAFSLAVLIHLAALIQLGSRAVLAAVFLTVLIVVPIFIQSGNKRRIRLAAFAVTAILLLSIIAVPSFQKRLITELREDLSETPVENTAIDSRMKRWKVAADLIRQKPLLGYGAGAETDLLKEKYFQNKMYNSYLNSLNAHNQYLSFLLMGGVIALFVYCLVLAFGLKSAVRNQDLLFVAFMVLLICVSFSENYLMRNKGIFFFALFYSFFLYSKKNTGKLQQIKASGNRASRSYVSINTAI